MIPYLVQLLDITINNEAIPGDWKKTIVIPIYEGEIDLWSRTIDRSA